MVPAAQQDYFKYMHMFRGNAYKGASVLKSMCQDHSIGPTLATIPAAVSAIFTDASRSDIDALCCDALATTDSYTTALNTYLANTGKTDTVLDIMNDATKLLSYERNSTYNIPLEKCPLYSSKVATRRANAQALFTATNFDVLGRQGVRNLIAATRKSVASTINITAAINTWSNTNGTYTVSERFHGVYVSKFNCILIGVRLRNAAATQYFPAILRYNCSTGVVTLCMLGTGETTSEYSVQSYALYSSCQKPAYDSSDDRVYMFYCKGGSNYGAYFSCGILTATETQLTYSAQNVNCGSINFDQRYSQPAGRTFATAAGNGCASFAFGQNNNAVNIQKVSPTANLGYISSVSGSTYYKHSSLYDSTLGMWLYYDYNSSYNVYLTTFTDSGNGIISTSTSAINVGSGSTDQAFYSTYSPAPGIAIVTAYWGYNNSGTLSYWGHRCFVIINNTHVESFSLASTVPAVTKLQYDAYAGIFIFTVNGTDYAYKDTTRITDTAQVATLHALYSGLTDYIYTNVASPGAALFGNNANKELTVKLATGYNLGTIMVDTISA